MDETERRGQAPGGEVEPSAQQDILSTPPPGRGVDAVLAERPRRGRPSILTTVLLVGVLLAGGFVGGLFIGRSTAQETATGFPGGTFPGDGQPPGGAGAVGGAGFTLGTVSRVEGDTIYLETPDGEPVTVVTSGDTEIRVSEEGTVSDLEEGSTVVVQGDSAEDGSMEATSVSEGGFGLGGGVPGVSGSNG